MAAGGACGGGGGASCGLGAAAPRAVWPPGPGLSCQAVLKCRMRSSVTAAGCSTGTRCDVPGTSARLASGIPATRLRASVVGVTWSSEPTTTSVGTPTRPSEDRTS
ncbi:hypothetical protein Srufu_013140 [Streptomyces libani subsp. rufus]|nr:hypothetical protein Srufu_013140 [Streptomyces libani subsp. rufus]